MIPWSKFWRTDGCFCCVFRRSLRKSNKEPREEMLPGALPAALPQVPTAGAEPMAGGGNAPWRLGLVLCKQWVWVKMKPGIGPVILSIHQGNPFGITSFPFTRGTHLGLPPFHLPGKPIWGDPM